MDFKIAEEKIALYLFRVLDSCEMSKMGSYIDTCSEYKLKLREEGDIVAESAYTVPQIDVPRRPRQQLLSRIDAGHVLDRSTEDIGFLTRVNTSVGSEVRGPLGNWTGFDLGDCHGPGRHLV